MKVSRRTVYGSAVALAFVGLLTLAMIPLRSHLSIADDGLVLIVPVVVGAAVGGFRAGVVCLLAGFAAYDFVFIPPYYTPWLGSSRNWVAPCVYVVVMLVVSRVVASKDAARREARRQKEEISQLFEISRVLVEDTSLNDLLDRIVCSLREGFFLKTVSLLLADEPLASAATAGAPLTAEELGLVTRSLGESNDLVTLRNGADTVNCVHLCVEGRQIGALVLVGEDLHGPDEKAILAFANQAALAVERVRLREEAMRAQLIGEVEQLANTLLAAASHDLRTPLASIKTLASTLCDGDLPLSPAQRDELARLIDRQADHLSRLVANLLDMSRIQAGVLELRRELVPLAAVAREAVQSLGPAVDPARVELRVADDLPFVDIDRLLIGQVICNLVENASRHAPSGTPIVVDAVEGAERLEVVVSDRGAGVDPSERDAVFTMFNRRRGDGGAGLGLSIAKAFIEAHDESIWAEAEPGGGARFCFTISKLAASKEMATGAASTAG